ncbi:MAG: general secretion pathway protein GspB [Pseudomonadota bacterium]
MSYILDALKKNQLEQDGEMAGINTFRPAPRRIPVWLAVVLATALVLNILLMVWFFVLRPTPPATATSTESAPAPAPTQQTLSSAPTQPVARASVAKDSVAKNPVAKDPVAKDPVAKDPAVTPPAASSRPTAPPRPADSPPLNQETNPQTKPATKPAPKPQLTQLDELTTTEQTLYNGFNYTSHIYTDEPSECAIVIDGQRLQAGDGFKGLKVVRITEAGVIFEENRRGQLRHVEVSVIEQWDRQ